MRETRYKRVHMRSFVPIVALLAACTSGRAAEAANPQAIAFAAITAVRESDAVTLDRIADPELKKRLRTSRILAFHRQQDGSYPKIATLSDSQVVKLFCDAHKALAPKDDRFNYIDNLVRTEEHGDLVVVTFNSVVQSKTATLPPTFTVNQVVLKKSGSTYLFLWSAAIRLHVDLTWNAIDEIPTGK